MSLPSEEQCMGLLDFSRPSIDVAVLEQVAQVFYNSQSPPERKLAEQVLNNLQEHEAAWTRVHQILTEATSFETKYFALRVLERVINSQWNVLPEEQATGIRNFIVQMCIENSSSFEALESQESFLTKCNVVLVQILKRDWPQKWPGFMADLVQSSQSSESLCQNNMEILKLLSEEVFDFSKGRMTQAKAQMLKNQMCEEFAEVFQLCLFVLERSETASLVLATLKTLLGFMSWIPTGYIFGTELIGKLVLKFLDVDIFRNVTMQCLTEIAALQVEECNEQFLVMFQGVLASVQQMLPPDTDIAAVYQGALTAEQNFVQDLCLFLSTFLKEHSNLLENEEFGSLLLESLQYLVLISEVDNIEVFKSALDYWNHLAKSLYDERRMQAGFGGDNMTSRCQAYAPVLTKVRELMVSRMAKPEEVLVVPNDEGTGTKRVKMGSNTAQIEQYKMMKETLVYLTHLDHEETETIMSQKLARQVDGSEWSWDNLNKLCWAIGSISGAMSVDNEKRFLVYVIKELLCLCEEKRGKDHKAIIASNIMYVVGQYPRFLRHHWKFLKTVVNKLFEFMHEAHPGVQDMACDTFIKISKQCKKHFVQVQTGEAHPFIMDILRNLHTHVHDLVPQQVCTFFEAVGYMISAQGDPGTRERLIENLMRIPNHQWGTIINQAAKNSSILCRDEAVNSLLNIMRMNVSACTSTGGAFMNQLAWLYMDLLLMYRNLSGFLQAHVQNQGELSSGGFAMMKAVRKEILKLIAMWISKSETPRQQIMADFIPPLMQAVLEDYQTSHPKAREDEVLNCMAVVVSALREHITPVVLDIFASVFNPTLDMISDGFESFPDHRTSFYKLLHSIITWCFPAIGELNEEQFQLVINAIVWGFRHPMRDVAETSLKTLRDLLDHCYRAPPEFSQPFFQRFYMHIMREVFAVVTDSVHYAELNLHSIILVSMFKAIAVGTVIGAPLDGEGSQPNEQYVRVATAQMLGEAFPHLLERQLVEIVNGFFAFSDDAVKFKAHLRDFLVQCGEVAGSADQLYEIEFKQQKEENERETQAALGSIPGMSGYQEMD